MSAAYDWDALHDGAPLQQFAEPPPETKGGSKRSRQTYSKYQTAVLETVFQTSKYIVRSRRQQMSAELSLTERQIKIWFQNRRMKEKKCGVGVHCDESSPPPQQPQMQMQPLPDDRAGGYAGDFAGLARTAGYHASSAASADEGAGCCSDPHPCAEDGFADFCHRPAAGRLRPPPQPPARLLHDSAAAAYAGYGHCAGGYDPVTAGHGADAYVPAKQPRHWDHCAPAPVTAMDYGHDDFFADHDLDHFHHHHHHHRPLMNSQVPDYCPPQLQATHGY